MGHSMTSGECAAISSIRGARGASSSSGVAIALSRDCPRAPGGIRTPDPRIRSPLLFPLSYGRV
jgi:hypothetical protein